MDANLLHIPYEGEILEDPWEKRLIKYISLEQNLILTASKTPSGTILLKAHALSKV